MGKLVFNIRKHKGNGGAIGNHIDRVKGMESTYKNADPKRLHLNKKYAINKFCDMKLSEAIKLRIQEGYKGKRKIRFDAVKSLGVVLTGSHEEMKKIFSNPKKRTAWLEKSYFFLVENFGEENIMRLDLHLDEKTPHLHAILVPLTDDGRLSAREVMGNKKRLKELRKSYAEKMKGLNLEYGIERTSEEKATSTEINDFYNLTKNFNEEYQKNLKALKTTNFKELNPRSKTLFLKELQKTIETKKLTQDIFDEYLIKHSNSKGLKF